MTLKEAKDIVKAIWPKAVCCTVWAGENAAGFNGHWHRMVRSRRGGQPLSSPVSVMSAGADTKAWKEAAERLA